MNAVVEKAERKGRDLDDEIVKAETKLKKLREQRAEQVRKNRERNQKAIMELLRAEALDDVSAEQWKVRIAAVRVALEGNGEARSEHRAAAASEQANQPANV